MRESQLLDRLALLGIPSNSIEPYTWPSLRRGGSCEPPHAKLEVEALTALLIERASKVVECVEPCSLRQDCASVIASQRCVHLRDDARCCQRIIDIGAGCIQQRRNGGP